jgi:hypothetical protein
MKITTDEEIKEFVNDFMEGFGKHHFVKNENGIFMYTAKHHSINLEYYFEELIKDFILNEKENEPLNTKTRN